MTYTMRLITGDETIGTLAELREMVSEMGWIWGRAETAMGAARCAIALVYPDSDAIDPIAQITDSRSVEEIEGWAADAAEMHISDVINMGGTPRAADAESWGVRLEAHERDALRAALRAALAE
jgi:hypothetical protein